MNPDLDPPGNLVVNEPVVKDRKKDRHKQREYRARQKALKGSK